MPVLIKEPTVTQSSPFSSLAVAVTIASTVLSSPTHAGMTRLSWPGWLGYIPRPA